MANKKSNKIANIEKDTKTSSICDDKPEDYLVGTRNPSKLLKGTLDVLESFIYAIIAVLVIFTFFIRLTIVDGPSMENTLFDKNYLVVADVFFSYEPENGDIVVIHGDFENYYKQTYDGNYKIAHNYSDPIVKRVIATGGQTIKIDFNTLETFVDGEKIDESYAKYANIDHTIYNVPTLGGFRYNEDGSIIKDVNGNAVYFSYYNPTTNIFEATVPEGHIFVMGDNRDHSADSRIRDIGFIPVEFVVGKALFRLSPFTTF